MRDGIVAAGGIPFEFPVHPIQETGKRPGAALDRNLAYLGLVEVLFGYPLDGVVLTIGCDKTTPCHAHGRGNRQYPGDRAFGRTDAEWLASRRAHRLRHDRMEIAREAFLRRDQLRSVHGHRCVFRALCRLLQHNGHGDRR